MVTMQRQTAVTAYLKSKQLLLFFFELQDSLLPSSTGILEFLQRQTAVTAYLKSEQLLLSFACQHEFSAHVQYEKTLSKGGTEVKD